MNERRSVAKLRSYVTNRDESYSHIPTNALVDLLDAVEAAHAVLFQTGSWVTLTDALNRFDFDP